MKNRAAFALSAKTLAQMGKLMGSVIERRNTIPVLAYCRVAVAKNKVTFTATDIDVEVSKTVESENTTTGVFLLPGYFLNEAAQIFEGLVEVEFDRTEQIVTATDGVAKIRLANIIPHEDFPRMVAWKDIEQTEGELDTSLSQSSLQRLLSLPAHCISTEETRYYLNGLYVCAKPEADTLRVVATDGHRMAVIDSETAASPKISAIIPRKTAAIMRANLDAKGNQVAHLRLRGIRVQLQTGDLTITSKCIDGTYPDYTRVIPKGDVKAKVALTGAAVHRMSSFKRAIDGRHAAAPVVFSAADQRMFLKARDNRIELPCDIQFEGTEPMADFGFKAEYLEKQARMTPVMRLDVTAPDDPTVIRGDDPDALWILMPMRVRGGGA